MPEGLAEPGSATGGDGHGGPAAAQPAAPVTAPAGAPLAMGFRQDGRYGVCASRTGLGVRFGEETFGIPWDAVARLDFEEAPHGEITAGIARLTTRDGKRLAWTDPPLFAFSPEAAKEHGRASRAGGAQGLLRPAGTAGSDILFLPNGLLLAAIVIGKAGLAEQADGSFARPSEPGFVPPASPPAHSPPEEHVPPADPSARKRKQAVLLVIGIIAFSYMYSPVLAVALVVFLLVHEYGHVLAMKWSGVRTGGIFVVPFMGAVAVALEEAPTRWKEFVIAVMGPAFGGVMALGACIVTVATLGSVPLAVQVTDWWSFISLFNLLPLGMLDGGRIVTSIAFSTHRVVGIIASVLAAGLCVAAAVWLGSWLLGLVAVFTVLQMRGAARVQKANLALLGIGIAPDALRRWVAAVWQRIGRICPAGDPARGEKARRAVRSIDAFRRFFSGHLETVGMRGWQIAAAIGIYVGLVVFFLVLVAAASVVQYIAAQSGRA